MWKVLRQDDNANIFELGSYDSKEEAQRIADKFEAKGHKQMYWVEQKEDAMSYRSNPSPHMVQEKADKRVAYLNDELWMEYGCRLLLWLRSMVSNPTVLSGFISTRMEIQLLMVVMLLKLEKVAGLFR
jgi:hypothetical protein